jgi:hypothetical protein
MSAVGGLNRRFNKSAATGTRDVRGGPRFNNTQLPRYGAPLQGGYKQPDYYGQQAQPYYPQQAFTQQSAYQYGHVYPQQQAQFYPTQFMQQQMSAQYYYPTEDTLSEEMKAAYDPRYNQGMPPPSGVGGRVGAGGYAAPVVVPPEYFAQQEYYPSAAPQNQGSAGYARQYSQQYRGVGGPVPQSIYSTGYRGGRGYSPSSPTATGRINYSAETSPNADATN